MVAKQFASALISIYKRKIKISPNYIYSCLFFILSLADLCATCFFFSFSEAVVSHLRLHNWFFERTIFTLLQAPKGHSEVTSVHNILFQRVVSCPSSLLSHGCFSNFSATYQALRQLCKTSASQVSSQDKHFK